MCQGFRIWPGADLIGYLTFYFLSIYKVKNSVLDTYSFDEWPNRCKQYSNIIFIGKPRPAYRQVCNVLIYFPNKWTLQWIKNIERNRLSSQIVRRIVIKCLKQQTDGLILRSILKYSLSVSLSRPLFRPARPAPPCRAPTVSSASRSGNVRT